MTTTERLVLGAQRLDFARERGHLRARPADAIVFHGRASRPVGSESASPIRFRP